MKTFEELEKIKFTGIRYVIYTRFKYCEGDTSGYDFNETFITAKEAIKFCKNIDFAKINFAKWLKDDTLTYVVGTAEFENGEFRRGEDGWGKDGWFEISHDIAEDEAVW